MGMYTEIYVNVDLKPETPQSVIDVLQAVCDCAFDSDVLNDYPSRFSMLFRNGSYYTPSTSVANLTFDNISQQWSLLGKGDIKNYNCEIEAFF